MRNKIFRIIMGIVCAILLGACEQEGPAEKAGAKIDQAVEQAQENIEQAVDEPNEGPAEEIGEKVDEAVEKTREKAEQAKQELQQTVN